MKTNYFRGDAQSDSNVYAGHLLKECPSESIARERDMEDWWDRRAGGWIPDKIAI